MSVKLHFMAWIVSEIVGDLHKTLSFFRVKTSAKKWKTYAFSMYHW